MQEFIDKIYYVFSSGAGVRRRSVGPIMLETIEYCVESKWKLIFYIQ